MVAREECRQRYALEWTCLQRKQEHRADPQTDGVNKLQNARKKTQEIERSVPTQTFRLCLVCFRRDEG